MTVRVPPRRRGSLPGFWLLVVPVVVTIFAARTVTRVVGDPASPLSTMGTLAVEPLVVMLFAHFLIGPARENRPLLRLGRGLGGYGVLVLAMAGGAGVSTWLDAGELGGVAAFVLLAHLPTYWMMRGDTPGDHRLLQGLWMYRLALVVCLFLGAALLFLEPPIMGVYANSTLHMALTAFLYRITGVPLRLPPMPPVVSVAMEVVTVSPVVPLLYGVGVMSPIPAGWVFMAVAISTGVIGALVGFGPLRTGLAYAAGIVIFHSTDGLPYASIFTHLLAQSMLKGMLAAAAANVLVWFAFTARRRVPRGREGA